MTIKRMKWVLLGAGAVALGAIAAQAAGGRVRMGEVLVEMRDAPAETGDEAFFADGEDGQAKARASASSWQRFAGGTGAAKDRGGPSGD